MPNNESTTKFKADISQLRSAMQQAQREVKLANAQFKAAASSMDDWSKSADGIQAKLTQLKKVEDAQIKQMNLLNKELDMTVKEYGENSKEADNLRIRIANQQAALNTTSKEIEKYTKELDSAGKETDQLGDESLGTEKDVKTLSDGFTTAKGVLADLVASGIKMAITGLKNLASAAKEAYDEFDKGADAVIKATGATGEAAKELEENYNNVAHNVVGDMGDIGSALGEVNTRFGFTGDELEDATEQFMKFSDITGVDATEAVRLVSRALENSGMDAKEYSNLLDILAKAGQTTGVSVSTLAEQITKTGPTMRTLGFNTEETIAMIAKFEKEGLNTETVLAGMRKAVAYFGKDGVNAEAGFRRLLDAIQEAPDIAAASEIAIEAFGTKAGPELVEDIRAGKLEYQDFLKVLKDSEGTVTDTYEATQDGFDKITLAIQGGKADLGKFVREIATEYQDDIVDVVNKIKDGLKKIIKWVVDNADVILETMKSIGKVIAIVFAIKIFSKFASGINTAITAVQGFMAAIKGAEAATTAMNASTGILANLVSPGGAVVLGIAAVVAVTTTLINLFKEEKKQIDVLNESEKESIEKSHELKAAYDEMESARQTSMAAVDSEFAHYQSLVSELDGLVDENGKVKSGYEDRANFIMTTLNEALGMEMTMQNGIIQNYQKERQEINQLLETKKAELILKANEEAYAEAIQKKTEAATTYANAQETFNNVMQRAEEAAVKYNEANLEYERILREKGIEAAQDYLYTQQDVIDSYQALQGEVTNTRSALMEATDAYQGYNQTIQNYEGLSAAIISGDSQKIRDEMLKNEAGFKNASNTTADALKKQRDQFDQNYKTLKTQVEKGDKTVTQQMVDDAKRLSDLASKEYENSGKNTVAGYAKGLQDNSQYAEQAAKNLGYGSLEEFNEAMGIESPSKKTYSSGEYFAQGFINGMGSKESAIYNKAVELAKKAIQGLKDGQKEGSPSKITTKSGEYFTQGFINGIGSGSKDLIKTVKGLVRDAIGELGGTELIQTVKTSANQIIGSGGSLAYSNTSGIRQAAAQQGMDGSGNVTNNYNLVQNNTSPKALTALETYQARRQQVAMIKAMM